MKQKVKTRVEKPNHQLMELATENESLRNRIWVLKQANLKLAREKGGYMQSNANYKKQISAIKDLASRHSYNILTLVNENNDLTNKLNKIQSKWWFKLFN